MPRIAALLLVLFAAGARAQDDFTVLPYIPRAGQAHEAFIQLRNPLDTAWAFTIDLFDFEGTHVATAVAYVPPRSVQWVNSHDLEHGTDGNDDKDVVVHVDPHERGQGDVLWGRVKPPLPPRVSLHAYLRSRTGFVTEMSQGSGMDGTVDGFEGDFQVLPFFNPASNRVQRSSLRLVNTHPSRRRTLLIVRVDDAFRHGGGLACTVPPLGVLTLTASELEGGGSFECDGAFRDGTGKWTVHVRAADTFREPIIAMSLLHNAATGDIVNLSAPIPEAFQWPRPPAPRPLPPTNTYTVLPYIPRAGQAHEAVIQIRNPEYTSNAFTIDLFDREGNHVATTVAYVPPRNVQWVNSRDLEHGTDGNDYKDVVVHVERHDAWDDLDPDAVLWGRVKPPLPLRVSLHAYLRSRTGFVTGMSQGSGIINDIPPIRLDDNFRLTQEEDGWFQVLPFFNPASNRVQRSSLRIVNTSRNYRWVLAVIGVSDNFGSDETIYCSIPPLAVLTFTAPQLERGPFECIGTGIGDGEGKWTVGVGHRLPPIPVPPSRPPLPPRPPPPPLPPYTSPTQRHDEPIVVMSLLRNTAHPGATADDITNLSAPIPERFNGEGSPAGRLNVVVVDDAGGCPPLAGCVTVRNEGRYRSRPATLVWWWGGFLATGVYQERRAADGTAIPALEPGVNRAFTVEPPSMDTAFAADPYLWVCVVDEDGQPRSCSRRFRDTFDVALVDGARGCSLRAGCVTVRNEGRYRSRPATLVWWTGEHLATGVYQERGSDSTDVPVLAPGETRVLAAVPPARGTAFVTDFWVCVVDLRDGRQHGCSRKFRDTRF